MSRFMKLAQTIWHCQYHIVWEPKYRLRILQEKIAKEVAKLYTCIFRTKAFPNSRAKCSNWSCASVSYGTAESFNIRLCWFGMVKGRTAIRILNRFKQLKKKPYWGNHFWVRGYCVDIVGLDSEMIRKYVKYQEAQERRTEQTRLF